VLSPPQRPGTRPALQDLRPEAAVDVINNLITIVGVTAYDQNFPIVRCLMDALSYPFSSSTAIPRTGPRPPPRSSPPPTAACG